MSKLRIMECFGGIGACSKALERLGIEYEIVDYVEIDKYAGLVKCLYCGKEYIKFKSNIKNNNFCNIDYLRKYEQTKKEIRVCKNCGEDFQVYKSSLEKSNARGNFCCKKCYHQYLSDFLRIDTYRGFKQAKHKYFKEPQFCALCGTFKNIQIHHIIPYRLTQDNSYSNLIPLCVKHHKSVEYINLELINSGLDYKNVKVLLNTILRSYQNLTKQTIREVINNGKIKNRIC